MMAASITNEMNAAGVKNPRKPPSVPGLFIIGIGLPAGSSIMVLLACLFISVCIKTLSSIITKSSESANTSPMFVRANSSGFSEKNATVPYPVEGKDMETAAKKIEEMEKSLRGAHGQRRQPGNLRHKPADILAIAFAALLCGLKDYEDLEDLGRE
jgi:hypothetical protein